MTAEEWGTLLEDVATRVRDTKALVRRETARELMAVYRCAEFLCFLPHITFLVIS